MATSTALALPVVRPTKAVKAPSRQDRTTWYLIRKGYSPDNIAVQQGRSVVQVNESMMRMEAYRASVSNEEVDMKVNEVILRHIEGVGKVIGGAMKAKTTRTVVVKDKLRKFSEPDHATQLKAVDTFKNLMEATRPKTPLVTNTNNTQINNGRPVDGNGRPMSFEERLRFAKKARGDEDTGIIEAEYEEPQSVEDELSDIGIDIEDDDGSPSEE